VKEGKGWLFVVGLIGFGCLRVISRKTLCDEDPGHGDDWRNVCKFQGAGEVEKRYLPGCHGLCSSAEGCVLFGV